MALCNDFARCRVFDGDSGTEIRYLRFWGCWLGWGVMLTDCSARPSFSLPPIHILYVSEAMVRVGEGRMFERREYRKLSGGGYASEVPDDSSDNAVVMSWHFL